MLFGNGCVFCELECDQNASQRRLLVSLGGLAVNKQEKRPGASFHVCVSQTKVSMTDGYVIKCVCRNCKFSSKL